MKAEILQAHLLRQFMAPHSGRFYMLRTRAPHSEDRHERLISWTRELVAKTLVNWGKKMAPQQAADVLFIGHELEAGENLTQDNFSELWNFLKWRSFELPQRFIIVCRASTIPVAMANKLLKTLEEPQENTNIFFLCEEQRPLLATLEGRAIKLFLSGTEEIRSPISEEVMAIMGQFEQKKVSIADVLDWIKVHPQEEGQLWEWMYQWALAQTQFAAKENFLQTLAVARHGQIYHQSQAPIWFELLSSLP